METLTQVGLVCCAVGLALLLVAFASVVDDRRLQWAAGFFACLIVLVTVVLVLNVPEPKESEPCERRS